jgi:hypothetical protein
MSSIIPLVWLWPVSGDRKPQEESLSTRKVGRVGQASSGIVCQPLVPTLTQALSTGHVLEPHSNRRQEKWGLTADSGRQDMGASVSKLGCST